MAYIGQGIKNGTFAKLDTSGNTYNGSNVTFSLGTQVGSPVQLLVSHDGVIQNPGTDYTLASNGTQITFTTAPASGASIFIVEISGAVGGPLDSDLNGTELILDADGDTSLHASTDDQIDIKVAGADDFKFTANTFTANSGSGIVVPDGGLTFGSTAISSTAAELNILDGVTSTTAELNILDGVTSTAAELNIVDGNTSATSTTIADADRVVLNDNGTMVQAAVTDLKTYIGGGTHVKLLSGSASSSVNHDFQNFMDTSKYRSYLVQFTDVVSAGDNERLDLIFVANTTLQNGSNYWGAVQGYRSGDATYVDAYEQITQGKLGVGLVMNSGNAGNYLFHIINSPNQQDMSNSVYGNNWGYNSSQGDYVFTNYAFTLNNSANVTGMRITESGGNATTFDYQIYGILK